MKNLIIAGAATFALTTASFGAIRAVSHIPWDGKPKCWQMERHDQKMAVITNGGAKVVFIGDSITHFWEKQGVEQLKKFFSEGDRRMLDLGTSADRTEHVLWRLNEGRELDGYEAKVVLLMIGTNNAGHHPFAKEPPCDTILGIREILKTIRAKQPTAKIILSPIFPRGQGVADAVRRRNDVVNKEIWKFADGKTVFWCDFNDQFLTRDGLLSPEYFPDFLHPNGFGYEIWAAAVMPYIDAALSDGRIPMPPNRFASHLSNVRTVESIATYPATKGEDAWWFDRMLQKRNEIADSNGEFDLVLFGDSITHRWEKQGKEAYEELKKTYSVLNIGYGGDRTENLIWRGMNGELDGYKAKCVMLMIGTNNTWHRKDRPEAIVEGIRRVLDVIAEKQPQAKILLLPIFPFGDSPTHPNRVNNEAVNAVIRGFADGNRVIWLDFNAKFLDEKGDTVRWMPDRCHPNAAGYREIWLPAILPYLKEIVGK